MGSILLMSWVAKLSSCLLNIRGSTWVQNIKTLALGNWLLILLREDLQVGRETSYRKEVDSLLLRVH